MNLEQSDTKTKPEPVISPENKEFWEGCKRRELIFRKCKICGKIIWPPSYMCTNCGSTQFKMFKSKGKGKIFTYTVYRKAVSPVFENDVPYIVAIVELDEGPRLLTNIVKCKPEDVKCDLRVEVLWEKRGKDFLVPVFKIVKF